MNIALAQQHSTDDENALRHGLDTIREAARGGADLVVFPELSFTPFYPRVPADEREETPQDLAEPVPGPKTEAVAKAATEAGVVVVFNLLERDGNRTYDTAPVIDADGTLLGATRMMHITEYAHFHEQGYYAPGDTGAPVYDTAAGRLGVAICYDRHYPEYLRALALQDAEIVAVPQAGVEGEWPPGMYEAELRVASLQHGFFTALANRVGHERVGHEEDLHFNGRSFVTAPTGRVVAQAPADEEALLHAEAKLDECDQSPARTLFLKHRRPDQYERGAVTLAGSVPAHRPEPKRDVEEEDGVPDDG